MVRTFNVKSSRSINGVNYSYRDNSLFCGLSILDTEVNTLGVIQSIFLKQNTFLAWCASNKMTVVELGMNITFDLFWDKYDKKAKSSKKKALKVWNRLTESNQVKAFYFIQTYDTNRDFTDKKYAETYLNSELWNN